MDPAFLRQVQFSFHSTIQSFLEEANLELELKNDQETVLYEALLKRHILTCWKDVTFQVNSGEWI